MEIKEIENDVENICSEINNSLKEENKDDVEKPVLEGDAKKLENLC